jgi:Zn ribbon nucleic-acid-binding protein
MSQNKQELRVYCREYCPICEQDTLFRYRRNPNYHKYCLNCNTHEKKISKEDYYERKYSHIYY